MPRRTIELATDLERKYNSLEATRARADVLFIQGRINLRDKKTLYEGLFLKSHVAFEGLIEDLFFGLLVNNSGIIRPRRVIPRIVINSMTTARKIVFNNRKQYVDWIPYDYTLELSDKYFSSDVPFTRLNQQERDDIAKSHIIRNVIAHESKFSIEKFRKTVVGNVNLSPRQMNPAIYLMTDYRIAPPQTRLELYLSKLNNIAFKLCS